MLVPFWDRLSQDASYSFNRLRGLEKGCPFVSEQSVCAPVKGQVSISSGQLVNAIELNLRQIRIDEAFVIFEPPAINTPHDKHDDKKS